LEHADLDYSDNEGGESEDDCAKYMQSPPSAAPSQLRINTAPTLINNTLPSTFESFSFPSDTQAFLDAQTFLDMDAMLSSPVSPTSSMIGPEDQMYYSDILDATSPLASSFPSFSSSVFGLSNDIPSMPSTPPTLTTPATSPSPRRNMLLRSNSFSHPSTPRAPGDDLSFDSLLSGGFPQLKRRNSAPEGTIGSSNVVIDCSAWLTDDGYC
ncbi:hypothetical protein HK097_008704, partial [Rhizophlyctis rosea]